MLAAFAYIFALFLELFFAIGFSIFTIFLIYSSVKGSPYVPTKMKEVQEILRQAKLAQNQVFLELGCGDGRVVRSAAKFYKVRGVGVDVNPLLVWYASVLTRIQRLKGINFMRKNIFETDLSSADVVYLFLMPELLRKLKQKMEKELKKKSVVISHGFIIDGWEKFLEFKIPHTPFPTYFYRIS